MVSENLFVGKIHVVGVGPHFDKACNVQRRNRKTVRRGNDKRLKVFSCPLDVINNRRDLNTQTVPLFCQVLYGAGDVQFAGDMFDEQKNIYLFFSQKVFPGIRWRLFTKRRCYGGGNAFCVKSVGVQNIIV